MKAVTTFVMITALALSLMACADDASSPVAPSYEPTPTATANTAPTERQSIPTTTTVTTTPTATTVSYEPQTYSPTAYYDVVVGGICRAMNVQVTGSLSGSCQSDATQSFVNWCGTCDIEAMHPSEYDNYTLSQVKTILLSQLRFDIVLANSIVEQADRCGSAMYIYDATSGLNFLYIERVGDGKGLMKRH